MASDRPEQNDAEQDEKNTDENDLQEIEDLKIQGKTFLIDNKLGVFSSTHSFPLHNAHRSKQNNFN